MASTLTRKRVDQTKSPSTSPSSSSSSLSPSSSTKATSLKEKFQSIGLIAMILCFIIIGLQMTTNDAYTQHITDIIPAEEMNIASSINPPQSPPAQIEVVVHEDDGDVEVDVPQQLPPDMLSQSPQQNMFKPISDSETSQQQQAPIHPVAKTLSFTNSANAPQDDDTYIVNNRGSGKRMIAPIRRGIMNESLLNDIRNKYNNNNNNDNAGSRLGNTWRAALQNRKARGGRQKPLINIRREYHDPKEENIKLPTIEEMKENATRRFYSDIDTEPNIYGYDLQCTVKPNKCDGKQKQFAIVAGLYNTGTNVAYKLISQNCKTQLKFQPEWGKHEMITPEKIEKFNNGEGEYAANPGLYEKSVLIVVIKDPLTWIKSMCKANYDFRYSNRTWFFNDCPTRIKNSEFDWLPLNRGKDMNRKKTTNGMYASPIHLWNAWYSSIVNQVNGSKYPYLVVRFEDLLFRAEMMMRKLCRCLGFCQYRRGITDNTIMVNDEASKPHGNPRNRTMSFWSYSNPEYRYDGFTEEDLQWMLDGVNQTLLQQFGYEFDVQKTKRMRM